MVKPVRKSSKLNPRRDVSDNDHLGTNLLYGYIPHVLFIEPATEEGESVRDDQTHAKKTVTKKKEFLMSKVQKTVKTSKRRIVSKVRSRSSVSKSKSKSRLMIEIKSGKIRLNYFIK
jgi:hypothetical protein